jgi:hypothetical protein
MAGVAAAGNIESAKYSKASAMASAASMKYQWLMA